MRVRGIWKYWDVIEKKEEEKGVGERERREYMVEGETEEEEGQHFG